MQKIRALIRLSRYQEYTVQVTLLGLFTIRLAGGSWGVTALTVLAANLVGLLYVYMLNDVEDAPDDALDSTKSKRNPIAAGELSRPQGYAACIVVATFALGIYAALGSTALILGVGMLTVATIGTIHAVRLKGRFLVDLVWHGFVVGTSQFLVSFFTFSARPSWAFWPALIAVVLFSIYIELWQETRDLDVDRRAGLRTSAFVLGHQRVQQIGSLIVLAVFLLLPMSLILQKVPLWFVAGWATALAVPYVYRALTLHPNSLPELVQGSHSCTIALTTGVGLLVWFFVY